ncbi:MAG: hypothetical protein O2923_01975 [Verrucomicrobia bacterium]|nr:hypothetical protein [Verrucomicrobiota bacterium]MDA1086831.1 hypothetical protein [Verrucomicrobiota bacterium]
MATANVSLGQIFNDYPPSDELTGISEEGVDTWYPPVEEDSGFGIFIWIGGAIVVFAVFKIFRMIIGQRMGREPVD